MAKASSTAAQQRQTTRRCCKLTPHRASALSHVIFIGLIVVMLTTKWWRNTDMAEKSCSNTGEYICWISECMNGFYLHGHGVKITWRMFGQSVLWVAIALLPAFSGLGMIFGTRRVWDVLAGLANLSFLAIALVPDVLPGPFFLAHLAIGIFACAAGVVGIFSLSCCLRLFAVLMYPAWFILVSQWLVMAGAPAAQVWSWKGVFSFNPGHFEFTRCILEWTFVLGACTVCFLYSLSEDRRRSAAGKEGSASKLVKALDLEGNQSKENRDVLLEA